MKWAILASIIAIAYFHIYLITKWDSIVCKTFADYYSNRNNNPNCYFNPDVSSTVPKIISDNGYPIEVHEVKTNDGYILTLFRIKHGRSKGKSRKNPILLQHGLGLNAASFVTTRNKSLAFILADNGYDVWLGNFRGTIFSKHKKFNENDREYWNFTLYEYAVYDISAIVNAVHNVTKQKIVFIGYSLGTLSLYIQASHNDNLNEKVKVHISIAPTVYIKEWKSPSGWCLYAWPYGEHLLPLITKGRFYLSIIPSKTVRKFVCFPHPFQMIMCHSFDTMLAGLDYDQIDPETLPITLMHNVDATSCMVLSHMHQQLLKSNLQGFDHGIDKNMYCYGSSRPPFINISKYSIPTYIIHANNDLISTKLNVQTLYDNLPNGAKTYGVYLVNYETFSHHDFLWAKDVVPLVYNHIVDFINTLVEEGA